jgi:ABC-2 family transporter protein
MTAITHNSPGAASASASASARRKPVPWTRLGWVTWRQHRTGLAGAAALLAVIAVYLTVMGERIHSAYNAYAACHPASSAACLGLQRALDSYYGSQNGSVMSSGINAQTVPFLLLVVPVLVGAFIGVPVLAREFESGTHRFAWTQGAGRMRWTLARLIPLAVALTAAAAGITALFSWYFQPFIAEGKTGTFATQLFGNLGVSFAAWTLFAFALGAFLGAVLRRVVAAVAVTLAACTVLDVFTMIFARQHYMTALTGKGTNPPRGANTWVLSNWLTTPGGTRVDPAAAFQQAVQALQAQGGQNNFVAPSAIEAWMARQHYTRWWSYQPGSRWVPFQLIEGGWLLGVSVILLAATVWMVRRRAV